MNKLDINDDFKRALDLIEDTSYNIFVTGRAGTGKSTLLKYFRDNTKKNVAVLAPTGVAAVNIAGQTIHSFFGFRPDITVEKVKSSFKSVRRAKLYQELDTIIIDEISMVRADLLDCINEFLSMHGPHKNRAFGGIQMVFIGDLYQLPPVVTPSEKELFSTVYDSPYFFSAQAMRECEFEIVELNTIYRQQDNAFIEILNAIRNKSIDDKLLASLNARHTTAQEKEDDDFRIYITTTNAKVDRVNEQSLATLNAPQRTYAGRASGNFKQKTTPAPMSLKISLGAQVMMTNNDQLDRWINGTVGKVVNISTGKDNQDILHVQLASGKVVDVSPNTWEMYRFYFDPKRKVVDSETVGSYTQYPLTLAWAITIHKSQGKTFERATIDLDKGTFAHGQAYVALSRCVSLQGMILKTPIQHHHILVDERIAQYLARA